MKRDDDLLRRILLEYEERESYQIMLQPRLGMTADEQKWLGHVYLLVDAGLVVESGEHAVRISSKGHDYLATIKDEQNWNRTKDVAAKVGGVTRLCCTNQLMDGVPLSLDRLIPRFQCWVCRAR